MPSSGCKTCARSEEHTSELQSHDNLVCRLLLEKTRTESATRSTASVGPAQGAGRPGRAPPAASSAAGPRPPRPAGLAPPPRFLFFFFSARPHHRTPPPPPAVPVDD